MTGYTVNYEYFIEHVVRRGIISYFSFSEVKRDTRLGVSWAYKWGGAKLVRKSLAKFFEVKV